MAEVTMKKIVALCKRRGFVFPGSDIYGGLANTYDLGPLGVEMLRNIHNEWWKFFVTSRPNMFGLDTSILMSPKVWEASGHTDSFTDDLIDCKNCRSRLRTDHIIENYLEALDKEESVEGRSSTELDKMVEVYKIKCPSCDAFDWTKSRKFNLLFETNIGIVEKNQSMAYLRGEIAQGMFVNFHNILNTMRPKLPFGIAQIGKAFRNEITLGNFIFRTLEFNLAEFEYFIDPRTADWKKEFENWQGEMETWIASLGVDLSNTRWREHTEDERSFYSSRTTDLDYKYPAGHKEMFGLAYRSDYDLKNHMEKSGVDMRYTDPQTGEKFIPHVVEPTFGISRVLLALLVDSYTEEENRIVLKLDPKVAPYRAAVFPLVRNKEKITGKAKDVYEMLTKDFNIAWDDRGNIGKRYLSQDEIGTPHCITIDYDTLEDGTVTVRDRDTTKQERINIENLRSYLTFA